MLSRKFYDFCLAGTVAALSFLLYSDKFATLGSALLSTPVALYVVLAAIVVLGVIAVWREAQHHRNNASPNGDLESLARRLRAFKIFLLLVAAAPLAVGVAMSWPTWAPMVAFTGMCCYVLYEMCVRAVLDASTCSAGPKFVTLSIGIKLLASISGLAAMAWVFFAPSVTALLPTVLGLCCLGFTVLSLIMSSCGSQDSQRKSKVNDGSHSRRKSQQEGGRTPEGDFNNFVPYENLSGVNGVNGGSAQAARDAVVGGGGTSGSVVDLRAVPRGNDQSNGGISRSSSIASFFSDKEESGQSVNTDRGEEEADIGLRRSGSSASFYLSCESVAAGSVDEGQPERQADHVSGSTTELLPQSL